jgi:site-specific DNA recombinase
MKVAIYARYSSDNQRDASIADQMRVCRAFAERQGWTIAEEYADHAVSGTTLLRADFQALMRDALNRRFDVVLAESLDRFSRDQEDTAGLFKRLSFAGVNIVTLAEGDITHLHIGFKGYRTKVTQLAKALQVPESRPEATEAFAALWTQSSSRQTTAERHCESN